MPLLGKNAFDPLAQRWRQDEIPNANVHLHGFEKIRRLTVRLSDVEHRVRRLALCHALPSSFDQLPNLARKLLVSLPRLGSSNLQSYGKKPLVVAAPVALEQCFNLCGGGHVGDSCRSCRRAMPSRVVSNSTMSLCGHPSRSVERTGMTCMALAVGRKTEVTACHAWKFRHIYTSRPPHPITKKRAFSSSARSSAGVSFARSAMEVCQPLLTIHTRSLAMLPTAENDARLGCAQAPRKSEIIVRMSSKHERIGLLR